MSISKFQKRFTEESGIVSLMEDLGEANTGEQDILMLGGGNPAHIPEVQLFFQERMQRIAADPVEFAHLIGDYESPKGNTKFIKALVDLFNEEFGWQIGTENVVLTSGSQSGFFMLFNMFSGEYEDGSFKHILLPILPEYIGYSDLGLSEHQFVAQMPLIEKNNDHSFKYRVDFNQLTIGPDTGALCASRPTNPTGNVLSDIEVDKLSGLAKDHGIPLILDNAYGLPFPNIIFTQANLKWDEHIILCLSLSKLGLPGARTGVIIAKEEVVKSIAKLNGIFNLALGNMGPSLALDIVNSRDILKLSNSVIRPYYEQRAKKATAWLKRALDGVEYYVHVTEGAFFLWLWLPGLPISSEELYQRLKKRGVLVVPGNYFFPGLSQDWSHQHECIRISYATHEKDIEAGIMKIAEEIKSL
jgi:valine--pyruvate aminotransferase